MKRKIIALCMVVAMIAVAIVGSTMAYFTDTDQAVNVMTIGNVKIEQIEQERDANGELAPFTQMKELLPAVYTTFDWAAPSEWPVPNDAAWKTFSPDIKNTIDKFITVKNTGKSDAFVRTIVAVEGDAINGSLIGVAINAHTASVPEVADEFQIVNFIEEVMINGVRYDVYEFVYKYALASGETTIPSFKQIYLSREATQDDVAVFGETFDVLAISQAIQANGFTDAVTALNEGFGEVTKAKVQEWFGALEVPSIVSDAAELADALANGESVMLDKDVSKDKDEMFGAPYGNLTGYIQKGGVFDGNGKTLTVDVSGDNYGIMTYGGTIKNVEIAGVFRGIVLYAPTEDVIIDNVVINDDGVCYAINTAEHNDTDPQDLIVTNSKIHGWTSIAGMKNTSFTKCEFGQGTYYNNASGRLVKPYGNITFADCAFSANYYLDLSALKAGCQVVLEDCTINGVALTESTIDMTNEDPGYLKGKMFVELPNDGRTLADCVIFK